VAVTVTVLPAGTLPGPVYVVVAELPGDVVGSKLPHAELPQVTAQVTPAALLSLLTFAVKLTEAPATRDVGGFDITTEIAADVVMVIETEADFVVSATDVAATVTVFPVGTAAGAAKTVLELLPVELVGLRVPHDVPPQCTVQVTPAPVLSFVTTAVRLVVAPTATDVGGLGMLTDICAGLLPELPPHAASEKLSAIITTRGTPLHAHVLIATTRCMVLATFSLRISTNS
jgi:hypothetical protein